MTFNMKLNREKQLKDNNVRNPFYNTVDSRDIADTSFLLCEWARARNITAEGGATSYSQLRKLREEVDEFEEATTEEDAKLEFGDILVVCTMVAMLRGYDMDECMRLAYNKIKNRKGRMENGVFVKEQ